MKTTEFNYGSDLNGLVWGFLFTPGTTAQPIDSAAAAELLARGASEESDWFLWLHFSLTNTASEQWLQQNMSLPTEFTQSFHENMGSTRVEQLGSSLVAVIHDVLFDFSFDAAGVSRVSLYVEPRILVSARRKQLRSIDRLRDSVKGGETFRSTADLLAHLLRDQADVLVEIIRGTTAKIDTIEDHLLSNRISVSRAKLGSLRGDLVRIRRLLAPEPAALFRLLSRPPRWIGEEDVQDLRQSAEEFTEAIADSTALVERIKLIQEELAALINEQNNRSLFVLTIVTVLALPFNIIAGLLGMNVGGVPFSENSHGFIIVVLSVTVATGVVGYLALRRRRD